MLSKHPALQPRHEHQPRDVPSESQYPGAGSSRPQHFHPSAESATARDILSLATRFAVTLKLLCKVQHMQHRKSPIHFTGVQCCQSACGPHSAGPRAMGIVVCKATAAMLTSSGNCGSCASSPPSGPSYFRHLHVFYIICAGPRCRHGSNLCAPAYLNGHGCNFPETSSSVRKLTRAEFPVMRALRANFRHEIMSLRDRWQ